MKKRTMISKIQEICRILCALQTVGQVRYIGGWTSHDIGKHSSMSMSTVHRTLKQALRVKAISSSEIEDRGITIYLYTISEEQRENWCGKALF